MVNRDLLRQIDLELGVAIKSVAFWREQLPHHTKPPLKVAVERSLENALRAVDELEAAKKVIRSV